MRRGFIAAGVAVIMMILLTTAMSVLISCSNSYSSAADKNRHWCNLHMLQSAQCVVQMKLEKHMANAVQIASEESYKAYPIESSKLDTAIIEQISAYFQDRLKQQFRNGNDILLSIDIHQEDFEGLSYAVKEYRFLESRDKILLRVEVKNNRYGLRRGYTTHYQIEITRPNEEDIRRIWEKDFDETIAKYQQQITQELAYGAE